MPIRHRNRTEKLIQLRAVEQRLEEIKDRESSELREGMARFADKLRADLGLE
jgi:hypothetical protein